MKKKISIFIAGIIWIIACMMADMHNEVLISNNGVVYADEKDLDISSRLDMNELYGYASIAGLGLDTTTGGGNEKPVIVTSLEELKKEASGNIPKVIVISGKIVCPDYAVNVGSNKTIVGIDNNAVLYGGFNIKNASNIIVSNLNVQGTWPNSGPDDCFNIENSHHIWLNHLNIWDSTDGNIDIKLGSDYITVSWCKLWYSEGAVVNGVDKHGHRLSCLIGSGAGDHDATDMGKLHVTYHHNWFADRVDQRMPRVMYGRAHVYNNYYTCEDNSYCVGADCYASVLVENNSFNKVKNPHQFSYDNNYPACIVARGNVYNQSTGTMVSGQKQKNSSVVPFETTTYNYLLSNAEDVPNIVSKFVGPVDLSDKNVILEEHKNSKLVEGVEEKPKDIDPNATPLPEQKPVNSNCDNEISYDKDTTVYTYNGTNSDGSQAFYAIKNPFKSLDLSEEFKLSGGYPKWTKGVTISYWVNVPKTAKDAVVLNFNLENDRQMQREDAFKYSMCKKYSENDKSYNLGTVKTYVDKKGKEFKVLEGYGANVRYSPEYPKEGCYYATSEGGAYYACEKGKDTANKANWKYLAYIGEGYYENYGVRYNEKGGESSKIAEANISGSFSMYASGSVGYRQDSWHGLQLNPYLDNYGQVLDVHQYNQFYYWGSGGEKHLSGSTLKTPTMEKRGEWHFVVAVIQNDWVQYYMDGIELTPDYLTYWGDSLLKNFNSAGQGFNYGYGHKIYYRSKNPTSGFSSGMTILDFLSDDDTVLTVGGLGSAAERLGMNTITTPKDTKIKEIQFYSVPLSKQCILKDKIDVTKDEKFALTVPLDGSDIIGNTKPGETIKPDETEKPGETTKPDETEKPGETINPDGYILGDVNGDSKINLIDATIVLKMALNIEPTPMGNTFLAADYNKDNKLDLIDATLILQAALGII